MTDSLTSFTRDAQVVLGQREQIARRIEVLQGMGCADTGIPGGAQS